MKAVWQNQVLADSSETIVVEGNHYFPPQSINKAFFRPSKTHSYCPWKGEASYYHLKVEEHLNEDAAWYYPHCKPLAQKIEGYIAFWNGVDIIED